MHILCQQTYARILDATLSERTMQNAPETQSNDAPRPEQHGSFLGDIIKFAFIALLIVVPFRLFVAQPFIVSGASMEPTFETGQYLVVDQLSYRFEEPQRGDVVIFQYPKNPSLFFIKRIIGVPGEIVDIQNGTVTIHGSDLSETITLAEPYVSLENEKTDSSAVALKESEYFVLGDNRRASSDSRAWGALPRDLIVGRALVRLLPVQEISLFPGEYRFVEPYSAQ